MNGYEVQLPSYIKKNDKRDINNYRPIAVTNVIYKIRPTVITNSLKPRMDFLTNEFQNAYILGRSTIDVLYTK